MKALNIFLFLVSLQINAGFRLGPPLSACSDMYPTGHPNSSQTIASPFTFTLNSTTYRSGDVIKVFLNSSGDWFMEGALIQVRAKNCKSLKVPAVGTFFTEDNENFLEPFNCFGVTASALRHYAHYHIYNRTFYWTAPSGSFGDVHIRATIARNQATFWTNIRSETIEDVSEDKGTTCGAMYVAGTLTTLLEVVLLTIILK